MGQYSDLEMFDMNILRMIASTSRSNQCKDYIRNADRHIDIRDSFNVCGMTCIE